MAEPFKLEENVCKIKCLPDYWSNIASTFNTAADGNDQRCTYNNCKNWDYAAGVTDNKTCTCLLSTSDAADENRDVGLAYTPNTTINIQLNSPVTRE